MVLGVISHETRYRGASLRICYFAVKDKAYPRNRQIAGFFDASSDVHIDYVCIDPDKGFKKNALSLLGELLSNGEKYDVVILAEFSLQFSILARLFAYRKKATLVVDWFVGLYETRVEDYGAHAKYSAKAFGYWMADSIAARAGNITITDTLPRASMLQEKFRLDSQPIVVPVGAPPWVRYLPQQPAKPGTLRVLYYGNYIPLHGLETVIEGIQSVTAVRVEMTLIGDGKRRSQIEERVRAVGDSRHLFTFLDAVVEEDLIRFIEANDVILGIFGSSPKARSVIANKVWQGLACGRRVVTQSTPALDGLRERFSGTLYEVDATAEGIKEILSDPSMSSPVDETTAKRSAQNVSAVVAEGLVNFHRCLQMQKDVRAI